MTARKMRHGRIKFYDFVRGFGFIVPDDGGDDVLIKAKILSKTTLGALDRGKGVRFHTTDAEPTRAASVEVTAYVVLDLPAQCSHRWAARNNETHEVRVYRTDEIEELRKWMLA